MTMIHVLSEPMTPEQIAAFREGEREHIMAYGAALAHERAALAAVGAWRDLYACSRGRMNDATSRFAR